MVDHIIILSAMAFIAGANKSHLEELFSSVLVHLHKAFYLMRYSSCLLRANISSSRNTVLANPYGTARVRTLKGLLDYEVTFDAPVF